MGESGRGHAHGWVQPQHNRNELVNKVGKFSQLTQGCLSEWLGVDAHKCNQRNGGRSDSLTMGNYVTE